KAIGPQKNLCIFHIAIKTLIGKLSKCQQENNSFDLNELQLFLAQSVKDYCEELMVKMLHGDESFYESSKRPRIRLKPKKDYLAGVSRSCRCGSSHWKRQENWLVWRLYLSSIQ
ncbi:hypothetical protein METBIDRAFT_228680, partial [Metschnikowia bicuspidata var. bicuspidata NRRL YB-4993]